MYIIRKTNKFNFILLLILLCLLRVIQVNAQQQSANNNTCLSYLKSLYSKMNDRSSLEENKIFYLNYTASITLDKENHFEKSTTTAEVYANKHKSFLISKEMEIYQDEKYVLSISPMKKQIFITNLIGKSNKNDKLKYISFLQDTLFSMSEVEFCDDTSSVNGKIVKKVKLKVSEAGQKNFNISTIEFYINKQTDLFEKILIIYKPLFRVSKIEVIFNTIDYNYKTIKLDKNILSIVFDKNNRLNDKYSSYTLNDNR